MTPAALREMGEDANNDEVERLVQNISRQRLEEMKRVESSRFGRVYPIGRDDYTREVTEESKVAVPGDPGKGTGVVCLLYKDGYIFFNLDSSRSHRKPDYHAVSGHSNTSGSSRNATQRRSLSLSWETNAYQLFLSRGSLC